MPPLTPSYLYGVFYALRKSGNEWPWLLFLLTLPHLLFNGLFASQNVRPQIFSGQARSLLNQSKVKPVITRERMLLMASFSVKCPNNAIFRGAFGMGTWFCLNFSVILLNELLRTPYLRQGRFIRKLYPIHYWRYVLILSIFKMAVS